jgi:MAM domain, meprin/A5/mu/PKD domain
MAKGGGPQGVFFDWNTAIFTILEIKKGPYYFLHSSLYEFNYMIQKYTLLFLLLFGGWKGLQAQISTFPHVTDFDSETSGSTSCGATYNYVGYWRNADQYGLPQANVDWTCVNVATPSTTTGPDVDHTTGTGRYSYVESSCSGTGYPSRTAELVSGYYDFSAVPAPLLSFWYHMYGQSMGTLHVDVDTTQGSGAWVLNVIPAFTDNLNLWQEKVVNLTAFGGRDSVRLRIRAITGSNFYSDMAVDDITVYQLLATNLQALSVNAGGGCGNSAQTPMVFGYVNFGTQAVPVGDTLIFQGQAGAAIFSDTVVLTQAIPSGDTVFHTFINGSADLSGPTAISLSASVLWGEDLFAGNNSVSGSAIGVPIVSTFPYFQNFEQGRNGWIENAGTNGTWAFGTPAKAVINSAASGQNCFVNGGLTGNYSDNDNSYVESPCFDFSNMCAPGISLKVNYNAEFSWDGLNITASTDGGATWQLVGGFGDPYNWYTDNSVNGNPGGFQSAWSGRQSTGNGSNGWLTARHQLLSLAGQPTVRLRLNFGSDGSVTDEGVAFDDIMIYDGAGIGPDQSVCGTANLTLEAGDGNPATYQWSTGATSSNITVSQSGTYTVTVTSSPSCVRVGSTVVVVIDSTTRVQLGPDSSYCGAALLDAGYWPQSSYLWSNGATSQTLSAGATGTYTVDVTTPCGTLRDTVAVTVLAAPVPNLGPDVIGCDSVTLSSAAGFSSYLWNGGQTSSAITTSIGGLFWVDVIDSNGCTASDSIGVQVGQTPLVNLQNQTLCDGLTGTLDAGQGGSSYLWSTGDTTQMVMVAQAGTFSVTVSDALGCTGSGTSVISVANTPGAQFAATQGAGGLAWTFGDLSSGTPTSWLYDFGDGNTATTASPTHTYAQSGTYTVTLIVTNACGSDTSSQSLIVLTNGQANINGQLTVYPQPNDGTCWMEMPADAQGSLELSVWDVRGACVRKIALQAGPAQVRLDLGPVATGVYQLHLKGENGLWTARCWVK